MSAPLIPRGRRPLGAYISGYAAALIVNQLEESLERTARSHHARGHTDLAQQIGETLADLREAREQYLTARDGDRLPVRGNEEAEAGAAPAVSEPLGPGFLGHFGEVDVRAAALVLSVSPRRVRQLLEAGELTGRQDGTSRWFIDPNDLHRLAADRATTVADTRK